MFKGRVVSTLLFCLCFLAGSEQAQAISKDYTKTRHPIVLVGGFLAFDSIFGIEYFYGIADNLRRYGATVYETDVSEFQDNETRGEELLAQIEEIIAVSGADKVNIIAHSQGSPTARYVAAIRPDLVASVTSVHGMNHGTPIGNFFNDIAPSNSLALQLMDALAQGFGFVWSSLSGGPNATGQSAEAIIRAARPENATEFNRRYPQGMPSASCGTSGAASVNGVRYYSWGGVGGYLVTQTNPLDLLDTALYGITALMFPKGVKHDGVVPVCGMYLGTPIRHNYRHNHTDAQRQLFGLVGLETNPLVLYRNQANRLKNAGL